MKTRKMIPNTLTCLNLVSGCIATLHAFQGDYTGAFVWIIMGALFDFFDGFTARLLGVASPIGKELDSLADDITFGFAPAAIVFHMLTQVEMPLAGMTTRTYLPYVAFAIAAFSALRLAKFNLDARQSDTFIGLPTPANALFWSALACGFKDPILQSPDSFYGLLAGIVISCFLLVSEIPMFALKFKHFRWIGNRVRYLFMLACAVLIATLALLGYSVVGFSVVVILYVVLSVILRKKRI